MISIVTAYYNRKELLWRTLKTVQQSICKDFEFIIVDDASDFSQRVEDFVSEFDFVRLVRINPEDKRHMNPCIPFNLGFSLVRGDIVIIQAPECLHLGDVVEFVASNTRKNQYLVFSCYGLGSVNSDKLDATDLTEASIKNVVGQFLPRSTIDVGKNDAWIIHPTYRPAHYNFLTSMTTNDLNSLGGFDERFANGYSFDDTEFATRINKKGMTIRFIESPMCIHQFHTPSDLGISNLQDKEHKNRLLYEECLKSQLYKIQNSFVKGKKIK